MTNERAIYNLVLGLTIDGIILWGVDSVTLTINYTFFFQENKLRLVECKIFSKCKIFSGKENIFKCLVAFKKMFWKIFSSVWLCC